MRQKLFFECTSIQSLSLTKNTLAVLSVICVLAN